MVTSAWYTRGHVTKPNGSHGNKAEVESIKEVPIFPNSKQNGSKPKEEDDSKEAPKDHEKVLLQADSGVIWSSFLWSSIRTLRRNTNRDDKNTLD